jgi:hypothetical protein
MSGPRTNLYDWLLDGLDYIEEKLDEAKSAQTSEERVAAITEGSCMVPCMQKRLRTENEEIYTNYILLPGFNDEWNGYWREVGMKDGKELQDEIEDLRERINILREKVTAKKADG